MTAFVIILEMTGNHDNVIALMCAAMLGYGTARLISPKPLYHALSRLFIADALRRRRAEAQEPEPGAGGAGTGAGAATDRSGMTIRLGQDGTQGPRRVAGSSRQARRARPFTNRAIDPFPASARDRAIPVSGGARR